MRLRWIDALKGIGIMLVVFAHHSLPLALNNYIYSFHMPLFFFISGFLFDFGKYAGSAANFVKGRFRSLIVPYFCFAVLTCLFYFLVDTVYHPGVTDITFFKASALYCVYSILYALVPLISYNPALWFLPCLFVTELLFYGFAKKYSGETIKLILLLIASGILGYLYSVYVPFKLPWNADTALTTVVFYGAGNLLRKFTEVGEKSGSVSSLESSSRLIENIIRNEKFLLGFLILVNLLYFEYLLEFPRAPVSILNFNGAFFSFYFFAFLGTFAFIYLFRKIGSSKVLEYYGRNCLIVLALHLPLMNVLKQLAIMSFGIDPEYIISNAAFALSLTALNLLFLIPVIFIINNYFPFLVGKKAHLWVLRILGHVSKSL
ncbi:MAG: acyltransferase family protein [Methanosarcina barkeri]|nr:acyltransferase family protein [Methanosarcina sp. ERenArc_MAG2]